MANKYFRAIVVFALVLVSHSGFAQGPPPPPPPIELPIDGGILGLLIMGAGYAAKKIHDHSKK